MGHRKCRATCRLLKSELLQLECSNTIKTCDSEPKSPSAKPILICLGKGGGYGGQLVGFRP